MNGIIFYTLQEAIDLVNEINAAFKFLFKGITTSYTFVRKHPEKEEWAVIIDLMHVADMDGRYPEILNSLSFGVEDVVELDSSWIVNEVF